MLAGAFARTFRGRQRDRRRAGGELLAITNGATGAPILEHVNEGGSTMLQRSGGSFALCVAIAAEWAPGRANADKGGRPRNRAVYPMFGFTKTDGPFPTDFFT